MELKIALGKKCFQEHEINHLGLLFDAVSLCEGRRIPPFALILAVPVSSLRSDTKWNKVDGLPLKLQ